MKKLIFVIICLFLMIRVQANCTTGIVVAPIVDSITVDIAGNVTICWQTIPDPDVVSYTIFMVNPITGANDSINTVLHPGNCFTIPAGMNNSDFEIIQLGVVAIDACNNPSPVGVNYHNTMVLSNSVNICDASIDLEWNPYDDFTSGTNVLYRIFVSINAGPFILAGTTNDTDYTYNGIVQGSTYDFYVRAVENGGAGPISSSSNDVQINTINFLKDPQFNYVFRATVIDSQEINLQFYVDTAADVSYYTIKRRMDPGFSYEVIGTISAYAGMNPLVTYVDNDVDAKNNHYYYEIETVNTCGAVKMTSNLGKTIWLRAEADEVGAVNTLTFTHYEDWAGDVQEYEIYRAIGGVWDPTPIGVVAPFADTATFQDHILDLTQGNGEFCYRVMAIENSAVHVGGLPDAYSESNESCVVVQPLIYVPNAFMPLSPYNYEFKPVLTFSDPNYYLFQIYNKWGQLIFETEDLNEAWLGTFENGSNQCQSDSYVYRIKFSAANGEEYQKTGVVTLLR